MNLKALNTILRELANNRELFRNLLSGLPESQYRWRPAPDKWNLLEIVCHLRDEEREDFSARVRHVLTTPESPMPQIDPQGWVQSRNYNGQDYGHTLQQFLEDRNRNMAWLKSLSNPNWHNTYQHPQRGPLTAGLYLTNWLAHDYLHIRQIIKVKYEVLLQHGGETLDYAGKW